MITGPGKTGNIMHNHGPPIPRACFDINNLDSATGDAVINQIPYSHSFSYLWRLQRIVVCGLIMLIFNVS
jgi:hypothetical protein